MSWVREETLHLINLIEQHTCLWDPTDENRGKKRKITEAHRIIANKLNKTVLDIRKKINSLRSQMCAERAKVARGRQNATGDVEEYVPRWEYYNYLRFMYDEPIFDDDTFDPLALKTKEDVVISNNIERPKTPPLTQPPEKRVKTSSRALIDSISTLLTEMERDEPRLALEFMKSLRKTYTDFADRFDDINIEKIIKYEN